MIELNLEHEWLAIALAVLSSLLLASAQFGKERGDVIALRLVGGVGLLFSLVAVVVPHLRLLVTGALFGSFLLIAFLGGVPGVALERLSQERIPRALFVLGGAVLVIVLTVVVTS